MWEDLGPGCSAASGPLLLSHPGLFPFPGSKLLKPQGLHWVLSPCLGLLDTGLQVVNTSGLCSDVTYCMETPVTAPPAPVTLQPHPAPPLVHGAYFAYFFLFLHHLLSGSW